MQGKLSGSSVQGRKRTQHERKVERETISISKHGSERRDTCRGFEFECLQAQGKEIFYKRVKLEICEFETEKRLIC